MWKPVFILFMHLSVGLCLQCLQWSPVYWQYLLWSVSLAVHSLSSYITCLLWPTLSSYFSFSPVLLQCPGPYPSFCQHLLAFYILSYSHKTKRKPTLKVTGLSNSNGSQLTSHGGSFKEPGTHHSTVSELLYIQYSKFEMPSSLSTPTLFAALHLASDLLLYSFCSLYFAVQYSWFFPSTTLTIATADQCLVQLLPIPPNLGE